jgi:hypothetical protein
MEAAQLADYVDRYRQNVNFEYWRARCEVEQLPNTVRARKHVYDAKQLAERAELDQARAEFEKAWDLWAQTIADHPSLVDQLTADDLYDDVKAYLGVLAQMDAKLPADFKLRPLLERYGEIPDNMKAVVQPTTTAETPATETPKSDTPKSDTPKSDTPKSDTPKSDTPKSDTPKSDTPKSDPPKSEDAPKSDPTGKEAPASDPPKSDAPKTESAKSE